MSDERRGQGIGPSLSIHLPGNVLSQKAIPHNACIPAQLPFHKQLTEKRKDGHLCHLLEEKKKAADFHYDLPQTACG
jgi:hypothetical protein